MINIIARIYKDESTTIKMGDRQEEIKINTGIKQGCTASTVLFKIITFEIMKDLEETIYFLLMIVSLWQKQKKQP